MSDPQSAPTGSEDAPPVEPADEELDEPSTEKEPAEAPKAPDTDSEPSHEAVGIGVIDNEPA